MLQETLENRESTSTLVVSVTPFQEFHPGKNSFELHNKTTMQEYSIHKKQSFQPIGVKTMPSSNMKEKKLP